MKHRDKARELFDHYYDSQKGGYGYLTVGRSKTEAQFVVKEIIKALEITTGHCELRRLDEQEVSRDLQYWNDVITEIEILKPMP